MTVDLQACYKRSASLVYREIAGEAILVPIRKSAADMENLYILDEVGARIWDLLDGQRSLGDILSAICDEYEVSSEVAQEDMAEFLEQLEGLDGVELA